MALDHLRLQDLSDREVLLIVMDVADADGWAWAYDVGGQIGLVEEHRRRGAAQRLSWMVRYGAVEREHLADEHGNLRYINDDTGRPKYGQRWRLTELGEEIAMGQLRAPQQRALDGLADDAQLLLAVRHVATHARHSRSAAKLLEREWRHQWTRNGHG